MQKLNENQVLIQNTKTGKQTIVDRNFFETQRKNKVSPFHDFEIVPTVSEPEIVPTPEEIEALKVKMSAEGFKKNTLTKADKAVLKYIEANE